MDKGRAVMANQDHFENLTKITDSESSKQIYMVIEAIDTLESVIP